MDEKTLLAFDIAIKQLLLENSPDDNLIIPHRVFLLIASAPS
jgi:hypothetical protein